MARHYGYRDARTRGLTPGAARTRVVRGGHECRSGSGEEGRADVALTYAPFESGLLGRPVTLDDMVSGRADVYQREIDEMLAQAIPAR